PRGGGVCWPAPHETEQKPGGLLSAARDIGDGKREPWGERTTSPPRPRRRAHAGGGRMTAQPHLTGLIVAIVIGAGALHAVWNAIAKHAGNRIMVFALMGIPMTLAGALAVAVAGVPGRAAVALAIASAVIHVGYDLALMNSYRLGSFNHVHP